MTTGELLPRALGPLLFLVTAWLVPSLTGPTLPFGVRVPPAHAADPVIAAQRRAYRRWVGAAGGGSLGLGLVLALVAGDASAGSDASAPVDAPTGLLDALASPVTVLGPVAACVAGFVRARSAIRSVKLREDWYGGLRQAVAVDTSLRTRPERFPWRWSTPALVVIAATAVAGVIRYPAMPDRLPLHVGASGAVDRLAAKTVFSAFLPVFAQIGLTVVVIGTTRLVFRARADLDPARLAASVLQHRVFLSRTAISMQLLAAAVDLTVLVAAWQTWGGATTVNTAVTAAPALAGTVGVIAVAVRTGQGGSRLRVLVQAQPTAERTAVHWDDDDRWRVGGLCYVNREDPAVLVPKRFGFGWSLNFGNPRSLFLLLPPALLGVLVISLNLLGDLSC
ncbi:DUF5808 domain-containing protein [Kitasatospora sp. NPDC097643]|uniref:DUF1648 domain-containing protein n=1 Tax=Kitasatospora sp. NPDC097643 TaxID=3157230 RepID=UPI00331D96FD